MGGDTHWSRADPKESCVDCLHPKCRRILSYTGKKERITNILFKINRGCVTLIGIFHLKKEV
jgi:hypothetical protein